MPRPVCGSCNREMFVAEIGKVVEFRRRKESMPPTRVGYTQEPYQKWFADKHTCPNCGATMYATFGDEPVRNHEEAYDKLKADVVVPEL